MNLTQIELDSMKITKQADRPVNTILKVNLQQGFILKDGRIIAAYSHHLKALIFPIPFSLDDLNLSPEQEDEFEGYEPIHRATDSLSIACWNPNKCSHTSLNELIRGEKEVNNDKDKEQLQLFRAIWHFFYWNNLDHLKENIEWDSHLKNHLLEKLQGYINRAGEGCVAVQALVHWVQDISVEHQKPLLDYIKKYHWDKW